MAALLLLLSFVSCMQAEVQGTYQVEIEFTRAGQPISGLLILSKSILDVRPPTDEDRALLGEWIEGDTIDANSCFILASGSKEDLTPMNVRLFDARYIGGALAVPVEIYRTPAQTLQITNLEFFANAIGGEVLLDDRGDERMGRIHGVRAGPPSGQRCIEDLETFRARLRATVSSISGEEG